MLQHNNQVDEQLFVCNKIVYLFFDKWIKMANRLMDFSLSLRRMRRRRRRLSLPRKQEGAPIGCRFERCLGSAQTEADRTEAVVEGQIDHRVVGVQGLG